MDFTLKIWKQKNTASKGHFETYSVKNISEECSFLEMLDILNYQLTEQNIEPIVFEHDCREGICGTCGLFINGRPHGPSDAITTCQLYMREFRDGTTIIVEPWRARAFPVLKDLMVDRSALDKIIQSGGYISVSTGGVPDANAIVIEKEKADMAMDAAACIGCGACVAVCKNASAMLFTAAKIAQFTLLPQGKPEAALRVQNMIATMDQLKFGSCSNTYACAAECPKSISLHHIARLNREFFGSKICRGNKNK